MLCLLLTTGTPVEPSSCGSGGSVSGVSPPNATQDTAQTTDVRVTLDIHTRCSPQYQSHLTMILNTELDRLL